MATAAIVLAAGTGERFGATLPKQFLPLNGKMILWYSIQAFRESPLVDQIVLVCHPDWMDKVKGLDVDVVVPGGHTRNESTFRGLEACDPGTKKVLTHDGIRPFVDQEIIRRCVEALDRYPAVDTCIPSADTIIEVDGNSITDIPSRSRLRRGQTPQAFDYQSILAAYRYLPDRDATDDITLAKRFGLKCGVVDGSFWNIKITEPQDVFIAEKLMQYRNAVVREPDVLGKSILLLGGSGGIGREIKRRLTELGARLAAPTHAEVDLSRDTLPGSLYDRSWDCIIHCAGVLLTEWSAGAYDRIMNVNLRSAVLVADLASKTMPKGGNVIYVGSSSALKGRGFSPLYSASKAALNNFTEGIAEAMSSRGIRFNCVNPSQTLTPMLQDAGLPPDTSRALSVCTVARMIISYCDVRQTGQIVNIRKNIDGCE
jgi:ribitol-5-phosphate 2-dehydrogenase (NADP+) / D-ribitol-5-phosphate cytidylyltransferase